MQEIENVKKVREKMHKERAKMSQQQRLQSLVAMVKEAEAFAIENDVAVKFPDVKEGEQ